METKVQERVEKTKKKWKISVFAICCFTILCVYSVLLLYMGSWAFLTTMKATEREFLVNPLGFPERISFDNYVKAMQNFYVTVKKGRTYYDFYFMDLLSNSLLYSLGCTFFATITPLMVAYCVAKFKFKANSFLMGAVLVAMVIPLIGQIPSEIAIAKAIGFHDNLIGMWLMKANFLGMYFLIFYSTFKLIPNTYAESVYLDGGGPYTVFFKIMLPLSKTTISAIAILLFIQFWNDYQTPLMFLPSRPTAALGLYIFEFNSTNEISNTPMKMTASIILMLPVLIVFIFMKNKMMGNLTMGGLKE